MNKKQEVDDTGFVETQTLPWDLPRFRNWIAVARIHALWKKVFSEALAPLGIQVAHYDVLANIFHTPGLTQQALAEKLLVGRSAMSMLLPELERRELVERRSDETDRRVRRLWLTPTGEALTRKAMAIHVARIEAMMTVLSDAECDAVGEMMRRVAKALES
ncbi:DNA-binding MarR family transcriptional regulator [Bosea sp. BE125]|uniref:MarR family winged helix-turn-helix transcriptional regulator n=1 Tax=Bosea sp. BE125 TaxID=2817909 RepID=UPI00285CDB9C|nr:MarR family winged helix-turn-helix transcriptional regulator [Bosea sp. BE125]MDR6869037.1 DNA-binding MarR family transcriptional regulator [Bosea sp. BE125]